MSPITTTLPTEVGFYLFAGSRNGNVTVDNLEPSWCRAEIVRVHRDSTGKLGYMGLDFFYHPDRTVGSWMKIDDQVAALKLAAEPVLLDEVARTLVPEVFAHRNWRALMKDQLVDYLVGAFKEKREVFAARAVDRAIELGILIPSTEYTEGWWCLAQPQRKS